ncbi:hypothetical protein HNR46_002151 [Haloferula luteola]|uniref:Uncharacterized protein n=1 Tax=Haloferula luteola TaxID=595692 RepID=A0A840V1P0_9BACT|nr:hypothetical protein [Haloferula luteola]MBB5351912.1 hypothetical protein [Haloferula luteola]
MDREEARFILQSFRPDGADVTDEQFADALALAAEDPELGDWLARERASDAAFAAALGSVTLPAGLREEVLACISATGEESVELSMEDRILAEEVQAWRPPVGLRDDILRAMTQTESSLPKVHGWKRMALPLSAAAGVALALVLTRPTGKETPVLTENDSSVESSTSPLPGLPVALEAGATVPIAHVEDSAISVLESPTFSLDLSNPDHEVLFDFIRRSGRVCPGGCVPKGLERVPGVGCRKLDVDGKEGAIVCFKRGEGDVVHLVVFREQDVKGQLPTCGHPKLARHGDWSVARWQQDGRVFLLLGHIPREKLDELF